ncbi:hypothetical protein [uncultured Pseudoteredinibacter sp.]|uniref:hypothetical protein n=1 Tax=uncultured Pseudoteredinibacter sp. TaxID=1641701 RepID=UPI002605DA94|nr:hypothetical protein [uncultured Pseudoteredinibacter sp.]
MSIPKPRLTELVLQTSRYEELKDWYQKVMDGEWFLENVPKEGTVVTRYGDGNRQVRAAEVRACFMLFDDEFPFGQIFAIFDIPDLAAKPTNDPGVNHVRYGQATLPELFDRYEHLRDLGIHPHRVSNHGQSTSFYYLDPDMNVVEFTAPNFDDKEEFVAYLQSDAFKADPSGIEVDPEEFVGRFRSGVPQRELVKI